MDHREGRINEINTKGDIKKECFQRKKKKNLAQERDIFRFIDNHKSMIFAGIDY